MDKLSLTWSLADRNLRPTCAGKKNQQEFLNRPRISNGLGYTPESGITLPRMSCAKCARQYVIAWICGSSSSVSYNL